MTARLFAKNKQRKTMTNARERDKIYIRWAFGSF